MEPLKEIPASTIQELSRKFEVKPEVLEKILTEWAFFHHLQNDLLGNTYIDEPDDSLERTRDFARLSLFIHDYRENSKSGNFPKFKEAKFIPHRSDMPELKMSSYFANQVFASFLSSFGKGDSLWSEEVALKILKEPHKRGKRPSNQTLIQKNLIIIAYEALSLAGYKIYAPIVQEMLRLSGAATLSQEAIRQVINRQ